MINNDKSLEPKHPIGVAANRSGVSPDLLRAWERRYGAVKPGRTQTGRRLYTDRDIARLTLLKRLIGAGRRISDVAGLELEELEALANEDREAARGGWRGEESRAAKATPDNHLHDALEAVERYDRDALDRTLAVASLTMSPAAVRRELIVPLLHTIGDRWTDGEMRIAQEHMASAIVRAFLEGSHTRTHTGSRPRIALTTPAGQLHEMGALMAAAVAEEAGWDAVYLGADVPAEEIGIGARELDVDAVGISVVFVEEPEAMAREIQAIRQHLGPGIPIIVGGRAAPEIAEAIEEAGAVAAGDLDELRDRLERIRE